MNTKSKQRAVADIHARICAELSDRGYIYEIQIDNRGGDRARYIFVRQPISAKIRVSDHDSDRIKKEAHHSRTCIFDVRVNGGGLTWQQCIAALENYRVRNRED